jgi:hypothetical protein
MSLIPYKCDENLDDFYRHLPIQRGGSFSPEGRLYFAGVRRQRGAGLGGLFGTIARRFLPFATKYLLPRASEILSKVSDDMANGKKFTNSLKGHSLDALKGLGAELLNQSGKGRRRMKTRKRKRKTAKKSRSKPKTKRSRKRISKSSKNKSLKQKVSKKRKTSKKIQFRNIFD